MKVALSGFLYICNWMLKLQQNFPLLGIGFDEILRMTGQNAE